MHILVNNNMEHFYHTVPGFMNERNTVLLDHIIQQFPKQGVWVELGSWMGRSTAYSVVELERAGKLGPFYCVDTWRGGEEHQGWNQLPTLRRDFEQHMLPIRDRITPICTDSWAAAQDFQDSIVNFCYVDAGHTYDCVTYDIEAWWPKIKSGSYMAGDDYTKGFPGVQQAVWDFFRPKNIKITRMGRCWQVIKP